MSTHAQSNSPALQQMAEIPSKQDDGHPFYNYTSGRWLYNEHNRLAERHLIFDVTALLQVIAEGVERSPDSILKFSKIAEGGSYRVFEAVFADGFAVIARLPYPCTVPRSFGIASEVATMQFMRLHDIPVPQVYAWASSATNAVGSAYIIMAKADGQELEHAWYTMTVHERMNVMESIVDMEKKLFQIRLPASGSLYHTSFLEAQKGVAKIPLDTATAKVGEFCIGPSTEYLWWYSGRDALVVKRGPWNHTEDVMRSVGERELAWLEKFGRFRYPREPLYRAFYSHQQVDPEVQKRSLRDYLKVAPLVIPEQSDFNMPTIRHPDLSPNNIFISNSGNITGLIDWQHTSILPLFLQAKIPKHFQNWGDDESESMQPPRLPDNFDSMAADEKEAELEIYRRRQTHYFYMGYTSRNNETHFNAIGKPRLIMTNRLFDTAARPWEGDNASLKAELIRAIRHWPEMRSSQAKSHDCPVQYTAEEVTKYLAIDKQQQEADAQMQTLRDCFTTDIEGWVPADLYEQARARAYDVRAQMLEAAESEEERKEVEDNWPFQDHIEID